MQTVTIHDAKTNLSKYIALAKKGKRVYIGGFGRPEVVLIKVARDQDGGLKRDFSMFKGKVKVKKGAFSDKTDKQIEDLLVNSELE